MKDQIIEESPTIVSTIVKMEIDLQNANYKESIKELREKLSVNPSNCEKVEQYVKRHQRVPNFVLLAKKLAFQPMRWIHITLCGGVSSDGTRKKVTLAVRDDNVYLMGFWKHTDPNNQKGQWYEFTSKDKGSPFLEDPIFLGYDSNYGRLLGGLDWNKVMLGQNIAIKAVNVLYDYGIKKMYDPIFKMAFVQLIVMICESARMDLHMKRVDVSWSKMGLMVEREFHCLNVWGKMSKAMMGYGPYQECVLSTPVSVKNHHDALQIVYLISNSPKGLQSMKDVYGNDPTTRGPGGEDDDEGPDGGNDNGGPDSGRRGDGRSANVDGGGGRGDAPSENGGSGGGSAGNNGSSTEPVNGDHKHAYNTKSLLEVFDVCATGDIASLDRIAVFDGKRGQVIYRKEGNLDVPSNKDIEVNLLLMGPYTAISASGMVGLRISTVSETNTTDHDFVIWNPYNEKADYDELLCGYVTRELKLTYAVFSSAVKATVQVELLLFRQTDFNGKITAESHFQSEKASVVLFKEGHLHLRRSSAGSTIPLKRSVVAWSSYSPLNIKVACFHSIYFSRRGKKYRTKTKHYYSSTKKEIEGTSSSASTNTHSEGLEFSFKFNEIEKDFQYASLEGFGYICVSVNRTIKDFDKPNDSIQRSLLMDQFKNDISKETNKARDDMHTVFTIPGEEISKVTIKVIVSKKSGNTSTSEALGNVPITESVTNQSTFLDVYPLQLEFPFKPKKVMCLCSPIRLKNRTDDYVIFKGRPCTPKVYLNGLDHLKGIIPPRSSCTYVVNMEKMDSEPANMDALSVTLESCAAEMMSDTAPPISGQLLTHVVTPKAICEKEEPILPKIEVIMMKDNNFPPICSMDVHPDKPLILAGHKDGRVSIWNYETQEKYKERTISFRTNSWISSVKFVGRMGWYVAGDGDGTIHVLEYVTGSRVIHQDGAHDRLVNSLAVHPNSDKNFVLSSDERVIKLWNWVEVKDDAIQEDTTKTTFRLLPVRQMVGQSYSVRQVVFNPDGNSFASAYGTTVKIWRTDDFVHVKTFLCDTDEQTSVAYFSFGDQQYMIAESLSGRLRIWCLETKELIKMLKGHHSHEEIYLVNCVNGISDDKNIYFHQNPLLVTASTNYGVSFLDAGTYEPRYENIKFFLGEALGFAYVEVKGRKSLVLTFADGIAIVEMKEYPVGPHATGNKSSHASIEIPPATVERSQ